MNIWLMKTFKEWANRFVVESNPPYVAIDEPGVSVNYGELSEAKREKLFKDLAKEKNRRWGLIRRFFTEFYDVIETGDILVLGTGQTTKFYVTAIVRIIGDAYYVDEETSEYSRHRRKVEILWREEPFLVQEWGYANRLQRLDTEDRLKEFIKVYTDLK
jgi:hypothetical protein